MSNLQFGLITGGAFLLALAIIIPATQNPMLFKLNVLTLQISMALWALILSAAFLGAALVFVIGLGRELTNRAALASLRQQLAGAAKA